MGVYFVGYMGITKSSEKLIYIFCRSYNTIVEGMGCRRCLFVGEMGRTPTGDNFVGDMGNAPNEDEIVGSTHCRRKGLSEKWAVPGEDCVMSGQKEEQRKLKISLKYISTPNARIIVPVIFREIG